MKSRFSAALQQLKETYANRLASASRQVTNLAVADTACGIAQRAQELYLCLLDTPVSQQVLAAVKSAASVEPGKQVRSVEPLVAALKQAAGAAKDELTAGIQRLQTAVEQYDGMLAALEHGAEAEAGDQAKLAAAVEKFSLEVYHRCQTLVDMLAEQRYDRQAYRRLLVDEALDQSKLVLFLAEQSEAEFRRQREIWQLAAERLGIKLEREPKRESFDPTPVIEAFLLPIQMNYERPSMLKSVLQAISGGRFQEKLLAEVHQGLQQMRPHLVEMIMADWQRTQAQWHKLAQTAAAGWLQASTGMDRPNCMTQIAAWQAKCQAIEAWLENLECLTVTRTLSGWSEAVRQGALRRINRRISQEATHGIM